MSGSEYVYVINGMRSDDWPSRPDYVKVVNLRRSEYVGNDVDKVYVVNYWPMDLSSSEYSYVYVINGWSESEHTPDRYIYVVNFDVFKYISYLRQVFFPGLLRCPSCGHEYVDRHEMGQLPSWSTCPKCGWEFMRILGM